MNRQPGWISITALILAVLFLLPAPAAAAEETGLEIEEIVLDSISDEDWFAELFSDEDETAEAEAGTQEEPEPENPARTAFINDIIERGKKEFEKTRGKMQRAQYKEDIYICKNFTVYLFRSTRDSYRMAEYPDVKLKIPDNLPSAQCRPYAYGYAWKEVPASEGNPFEIAARFLYDTSLTKDENMEKALEFMRQVRRGDFFQMTAEYSHGNGAHSAIMIADYDPVTDTVRWMDSNMVGKKINGERYGKVQFDESESIEWWADAFCKKKRGATIYRLRDDIIFAGK
jgi:hypothetical protein